MNCQGIVKRISLPVMALFVTVGLVTLPGCSQQGPLSIDSAQVLVDVDRGSGNFNRVLEICLNEPLKMRKSIYHTMSIETFDGYQLAGGSWLRHQASDPTNPCQLRNFYLYLGRDDPPGSRQFIDDYIRPGNIKRLELKLYLDDPAEPGVFPISQRVFEDI